MFDAVLIVAISAKGSPRKKEQRLAHEFVSGEVTVFLVVMFYDFVFHFFLLVETNNKEQPSNPNIKADGSGTA